MLSEKSILGVLDHPFVVQLGGTFQGVHACHAWPWHIACVCCCESCVPRSVRVHGAACCADACILP
jgi:hypothetical protein